jgi:hypothetical protein
MSSSGIPWQYFWRLSAFICRVWAPVFFLTPEDILPIFSKKQRAIMNIVLMCFVCFLLFSYAACFYLAAINFRIQSVNLTKFFAYLVFAMPCIVERHPQTPGA